MKKVFILFFILLFRTLSYAQGYYQEHSTIGVVTDNAKEPFVVFLNTYSEITPQTGACVPKELCADNEWVVVDIRGIVPEDTGAVFLSGLLLITHGRTNEICDLHIGFREFGSDFDGGYLGQAIEAQKSGGIRAPFSSWVPVVNRKFEMKWTRSTYAQWPTSCAYGINLTLQAYVR